MKAVLYARVSTTDQVEKGQSMETQISKLTKYANYNEFTDCSVITDEGISGYKKERPGYTKVMQMVQNKEIDAVIVYSLSRFGRSTLSVLESIEVMKANDVTFHSLTEKIDTNSPMGNFFITIIAALSELERQQISERTKAVLQHKKENGYRVGTVPYGYKADPKTGKLSHHDAQRKIIAQILDRRERGWSYRQIVKFLNNFGKRNNKNRCKWSVSMVYNIYKKWSEAGYTCKFDNQLKLK